MKAWKTKNGFEIHHLLHGRCNVYCLRTDDHNVIVDTGTRKNFDTLRNVLDEPGYAEPGIEHLVLTHTHYDHCQSARRLKEKYDCKIVVSSKAKASIANGYTRLPNGTNFLSNTIVRMGRRIGKPKYGYDPFEADILVDGDYHLRIGDVDVTIIETPGHSSDSISILVDDEVALVGDAMFGVLKNSIFPPFADDIKMMIRSWGKLLDTACSTFLPGHGKAVGRERLQSQYEKYARKYPFE
ncbi:MAG: MBL fold metallo-hydrolase [Bacteroidales bacterium]|nr:MBL fold metallo-hydrolase [Bacteroidales bacterium]